MAVRKVDVKVETLTPELFAEIVPLGQKCWNESTENKGETCAYYGDRDFDIQPDYSVYERARDNNILVIQTMRHNGSLVGYGVGFLYNSWHHKNILCANIDSVYVEPDFRNYAPSFLKKYEKVYKELGVQIVGWPTHINGPIFKLLTAMGYVGDDIVMEKRL